MKKRVLSMAMATVMAASLTACGSGSTATTAAPTETNADTSAAASEAASEAAGSSDADVQKIIDRGVLKVGCKSDVPNFSLQNTATGEYEGFEDDLAYEIAGDIADNSCAIATIINRLAKITHEVAADVTDEASVANHTA